jgi:hypothetical protein
MSMKSLMVLGALAVGLGTSGQAYALMTKFCTGGVIDFENHDRIILEVDVWNGQGGPYGDLNPGKWTVDILTYRNGTRTQEGATYTGLKYTAGDNGAFELQATGQNPYLFSFRLQADGSTMMMAPELKVLSMYYGGTWLQCRDTYNGN